MNDYTITTEPGIITRYTLRKDGAHVFSHSDRAAVEAMHRQTLAAGDVSDDPFFIAYVQAVYFTETGDLEQPEPDAPLAEDARGSFMRDCERFQTENAALLAQAYARDGYGGPEQAGHDFWLTRNGHGAGFWDRPALKAGGLGDALSDAAHAFGECYVYENDNGELDDERPT